MGARLVIATTNSAKLAEYRLLLAPYPLELVSLRDVGIDQEPAETGATFRENALIKARFYFELTRLPTLADDGGLEVDALHGAPGVNSHRWLGAEADDRMLAEEIVRRMAQVPDGRRGARIRCALALTYSQRRRSGGGRGGSRNRRRDRPSGSISRYGLDFLIAPCCICLIRECYLAELGEEEEARIGQRRTAVELAEPYLKEIARMRCAS